MDILDLEITTDEIQAVGANDKIIVQLKDNDILQLDNFEFKNVTRIEFDKMKDCDGFNRAYIYNRKEQIGLLRLENKLFLEKISDITNLVSGEKGKILNLSDSKFDINDFIEVGEEETK
jgi:hypothetical protein